MGAARGKLLSGASTAIIIDARNDAGARSECLFRRLRFKLPDDHISYSMGCHDGCDGRHFNCVPDSSFAENPEHLCAWTVDGKGRRAVGLGALDVETVPINAKAAAKLMKMPFAVPINDWWKTLPLPS